MSALGDLHKRAAELRIYLDELITGEKPVPRFDSQAIAPGETEFEALQKLAALDLDLIVTHVEINDFHGTGILVKRMFPDWRQILHVWTCHAYPSNDFGVLQLFVSGWLVSRSTMYRRAIEAMRPYQLRRIFCVPFSEEDLHFALAIKDAREVPLAIYVMDDQNLTNARIPDALLREAFEKADLVFAISPEMREAYESKFGIPVYLLPPLVRARDLVTSPIDHHSLPLKRTGVLMGNIWNAEWLAEIRRTLRGTGVEIHWYGNAGKHVEFDEAELAADGLIYKGALPETEICSKIREYGFGLLPSSPEDKEDWLAKYSIPTRLVTSIAAGNLPMIVVGSDKSASSQFVQRLGLGVICPYNPKSFQDALAKILDEDAQSEIRERETKAASLFADQDISQWLWQSLDRGEPADRRFESLFDRGDQTDSRPAPFDKLGSWEPSFVIEISGASPDCQVGIPQLYPGVSFQIVTNEPERLRTKVSWLLDRYENVDVCEQVSARSESGDGLLIVGSASDLEEQRNLLNRIGAVLVRLEPGSGGSEITQILRIQSICEDHGLTFLGEAGDFSTTFRSRRRRKLILFGHGSGPSAGT